MWAKERLGLPLTITKYSHIYS